MRFVDVAVDLAALLSASRSVAAKHVALRARQLDRYSKTSGVAGRFHAGARRPCNEAAQVRGRLRGRGARSTVALSSSSRRASRSPGPNHS